MKKSNFARFKDIQELLHSLCFEFFAKIFHSPLNKENNTMRNNLSKIVLVAFIALLLPIMSCDVIGNSLAGRWVGVSGKNKDTVMELLSDGTGIFTEAPQPVIVFEDIDPNKYPKHDSDPNEHQEHDSDTAEYEGRKFAITWKTENGRFYSIDGLGVMNYKLQGSLLTFTDDNGNITSEYTKCGKNCKKTAKEYAKVKLEKAITAAKTKIKSSGSFTDPRDGKTYKIITLNNQTWMAENLNYEAENINCTTELNIKEEPWKKTEKVRGKERERPQDRGVFNILSPRAVHKCSKCYENNPTNCQKYGRLYNWEIAKEVCPSGWHLPSNEEWQTLVDLAGGEEIAVSILKSSSDWQSDNGVDAVGFSALPGGNGHSGKFYDIGRGSYYWSATEEYFSIDFSWDIYDDAASIVRDDDAASIVRYDDDKSLFLFSVRCVQN